jgi:hypothetical protein
MDSLRKNKGPTMSLEVVTAAISALTRETNRIAQALERTPDTDIRREALSNRGAALKGLILGLSENEGGAVMREAALDIERIGRRLSSNEKNADEGAELLSIAQELVAAETEDFSKVSEVEGAPAPEEGDPAVVVSEKSQGEIVDPPAAGDEKTGPPAPEIAVPGSPAAEIPKKPEQVKVNMTTISETDTTQEQQDGPVEDQSSRRSDEALTGVWMAQNMATMNKISRNRYGDGKEVCLMANRMAGRDQRNVVAEIPAGALDWARSARRPVKLVLFIRPEDVTAGASMRVVTATLTTAVALATPGKAAKVTISLWDEFGDVEKANAVLTSEGSAESQLTEIQVMNAVI